jgi:hypothetical protein
VQALVENRRPVDDDPTDTVLLEKDVLYSDAIEDARPCVHRVIDERGGHLDRIGGGHTLFNRRVVDAQLGEDRQNVGLEHNLVEQHPAAPHAAAGLEHALEYRHVLSSLRQIVGAQEARRSRPDDGYLQVGASLELVKVPAKDFLGDEQFHAVLLFSRSMGTRSESSPESADCGHRSLASIGKDRRFPPQLSLSVETEASGEVPPGSS